MKLPALSILIAVLAIVSINAQGHTGPFDGKTFKGRIAWSADGNFNDPDDWSASPVALAIFARFRLQEKFVHCDYNNIMPRTDKEWEKKHADGVLGAVERYQFNPAVFHDCQKDVKAAIESIKNAINASSAEDPLYFVLAGPMEVPFLGIEKSDPQKRKFVYCISHSAWNDGYNRVDYLKHNKRNVIPQGINWVQITDQNRLLSQSPYGRPAEEREWSTWQWMKNSAREDVRFLFERSVVSTRPDCSDAGMAYFLMTGDERCDIPKLRKLLDENVVPQPVAARQAVRVEAENFRLFDGCDVEYRNDRTASHRVGVRFGAVAAGRIQTRFEEPYASPRAKYDAEVRFWPTAQKSTFALSINGKRQGEAWEASAPQPAWTSHTIQGVEVADGDEITIELRGGSLAECKLDYIQFNR